MSGALRQQHRRSPHQARGRGAKRINTKTHAGGGRNQTQGTLFFWTFSPTLKRRAVTSARTCKRTLTWTPPCRPMIWLPLTYLRPSTTSLCMCGCVTADLGKRHVASSKAPLFYEQTPTCPRIQMSQFQWADCTEDVCPRRTWQWSDYDWLPPDVIYYFRNLHIKRVCVSLHKY